MQSLVVLSHLRWNFVYQRPQHLLSRLSRRYRVLFVEEPIRDEGAPRIEVIDVLPGVQVLRPHTPLEAPGFHDAQLAAIEPVLVDALAALGVSDYAVWFYTAMAWPLIDALDPSLVVYDCMDELSAFLGAPPELREREAALLRRADLVLTGGPSLYEAKRDRNANVLCLPSSVDAEHFAAKASTSAATDNPAGDNGEPRPIRLGFFGVIDERMDIALLAGMAELEPEWRFTMVGPVVKIDPQTLPRPANIQWLGQRDYADLPALIASWAICLMPFAINEATRFISPTKTLEYMAAGKPVVSTAIRDVITLYGEAVEIADDAAGFVDACRRMLAESPTQRSQRAAAMTALVAGSSWKRTTDVIEHALDAALARKTSGSERRSVSVPDDEPMVAMAR